MAAERTPAAVRDAAERVLAALAADGAFVAHVAKAEIDRRVADGDLVPMSRLQMGGGLELTPIGRLAALEGAVRSALALIDADLPNALDAVQAVLERVAEPTPSMSAPTPLPPPSPEQAAPPATVEPTPSQADAEPEPAAATADGRPPGMPKEGEASTCERCDAVIEAKQAILSYTRFRVRLCAEHFRQHPNRSAA